MTTEQVHKKKKKYAKDDFNRNPTGKGGFGDNPQNRSPGGWRKETTIPYQMRFFLSMTKEEINQWQKDVPANKRTSAQQIALNSVLKSIGDLAYQKETTDRTSGRPQQYIETDQRMTVDAIMSQQQFIENIKKTVVKE